MQAVKNKVAAHVHAEAEQWLGSAMTYTLFQSVQENLADLIADQPDSIEEVESQVQKLAITDENIQVMRSSLAYIFVLLKERIVFKEIP